MSDKKSRRWRTRPGKGFQRNKCIRCRISPKKKVFIAALGKGFYIPHYLGDREYPKLSCPQRAFLGYLREIGEWQNLLDVFTQDVGVCPSDGRYSIREHETTLIEFLCEAKKLPKLKANHDIFPTLEAWSNRKYILLIEDGEPYAFKRIGVPAQYDSLANDGDWMRTPCGAYTVTGSSGRLFCDETSDQLRKMRNRQARPRAFLLGHARERNPGSLFWSAPGRP